MAAKCYKISCKECIKSTSCPCCKAKITLNELNPVILSDLDEFEFECQDCEEYFLYSDHWTHFQECIGRSLPTCPLECENPHQFRTIESLEFHLN
jgi:hypothetical protein